MSRYRKNKHSGHKSFSKKVWQIATWTFYILGAIIFLELLHELYHFYFCNGEFISGIGYFRGTLHFGGLTYCAKDNGGGGELIPTLTEIIFFYFLIWGKIKNDNPKISLVFSKKLSLILKNISTTKSIFTIRKKFIKIIRTNANKILLNIYSINKALFKTNSTFFKSKL